jgi:hypothetical protein
LTFLERPQFAQSPRGRLLSLMTAVPPQLRLTTYWRIWLRLESSLQMYLPDYHPERRDTKRMSVELELKYRLLNRRNGKTEGSGQTLNISSSGVLFTTGDALQQGRRLELSMDWPARLNDRCALKLVARGQVVRIDGNAAAVKIIRHEFRTRGASG